ncbi:MAG: MFS transporter [Pseudomonadota bacterium]|nr:MULTISPECIES: MFS transporter [Erythrobacteraceae]MEC7888843.1 MFS transporter [Pseudomonadota bacterium]PHR05037.1 MAG: MFS transporter [Erythrobacter sp.]MEC7953559.1 MFS transporter [Pseudomonadota bacterium]MEE2795064.1 MFS transporter [Pseudomonadota bacterium]PNQ74108.1 MFS transporter [Erythrobacter sp. SAORIC-644]
MNETDTLSPESSPLRIANFRAYFVSRLTMTLAQYAMMLIIGWQTYNIARDSGLGVAEASGQLALIGLLQFVPLFLLTPFSGWAADHFDRRNVARLTMLAQLGCAATLTWFTWSETLTITALFGVAIVLGIVRAFNGPALSALAPNLVPKTILPNAIALSSIAWQTGMIVGPAIGGYTHAIYPALPYAFACVLFGVAITALSFIGKVPQPPREANKRPIHQMVEGLRYVVHNKMVLGAITLDLFAVFLAGATALFPVFARDILQVGETGLAQLAMAPAVGAALTALWFSFRPLKTNVGPRMLWAVGIFGMATIIFGFSKWMPLSLAMLFIVGAADMFSVYIRQSLIQLHTPDDKRGRVSSVSLLTISASNEFGDFFSGSLAFLIGPVFAVVGGGVGAIVTVAIWARIFPVLRTTRTFDPPEELLDSPPEEKLQEQMP